MRNWTAPPFPIDSGPIESRSPFTPTLRKRERERNGGERERETKKTVFLDITGGMVKLTSRPPYAVAKQRPVTISSSSNSTVEIEKEVLRSKRSPV